MTLVFTVVAAGGTSEEMHGGSVVGDGEDGVSAIPSTDGAGVLDALHHKENQIEVEEEEEDEAAIALRRQERLTAKKARKFARRAQRREDEALEGGQGQGTGLGDDAAIMA